MHYFVGASSGSLAIRRTEADLADAVLCEIGAWTSGERDAAKISAHWRAQFLAAKHVEILLRLGASKPSWA